MKILFKAVITLVLISTLSLTGCVNKKSAPAPTDGTQATENNAECPGKKEHGGCFGANNGGKACCGDKKACCGEKKSCCGEKKSCCGEKSSCSGCDKCKEKKQGCDKSAKGKIATRDIQQALKDSGARIVVDGKPGPNTTKLLKTFQANNKLPVTGKADKATLTALGL